MNVFDAANPASAVVDGLTGLSGWYLVAGSAAIAIGAVPFALRRVWGLGKGLAK